MSNSKPTIVFIIGMHRCGTSLLTNCLVENGFDIGKTKNNDKNWQNPNGYFENDSFTHFHEKLLKYNNSDWFHINKQKMIYNELQIEEYRKLLINEFKSEKIILIKDPRLTFFVNFLKEVCNNIYDPYFIFLSRDKNECCKSLSSAQNIKVDICEKLYDITMKYYSEEYLLINHRDILYKNDYVMNNIKMFCNLNHNFLNTSNIVDLKLYRNIFSQ